MNAIAIGLHRRGIAWTMRALRARNAMATPVRGAADLVVNRLNVAVRVTRPALKTSVVKAGGKRYCYRHFYKRYSLPRRRGIDVWVLLGISPYKWKVKSVFVIPNEAVAHREIFMKLDRHARYEKYRDAWNELAVGSR